METDERPGGFTKCVPKPPGDTVGWIQNDQKMNARVNVVSFVESSNRRGKKHQCEWKNISNPHTSL